MRLIRLSRQPTSAFATRPSSPNSSRELRTNSDGNSELIDYLSKELVSNAMPHERLLKGIADELPMKEDFDAWSDFLRDTEAEMNYTGKGKGVADCVATSTSHFRMRTAVPRSRRQSAAVVIMLEISAAAEILPSTKRRTSRMSNGRQRRPPWKSWSRNARTALTEEKFRRYCRTGP